MILAHQICFFASPKHFTKYRYLIKQDQYILYYRYLNFVRCKIKSCYYTSINFKNLKINYKNL